ncbi:hypothetical protein C4D60_Mb10t17670 [Musa balbisiana]|uniref:Uncharacterized protein n=1 Tax=Musa balbisiana TaxID=52838 RepID=A0A4S8IZA0_MUSBA|nr:hypothetical protein C4D60_Mb10t17670 [Musa balbisiana]
MGLERKRRRGGGRRERGDGEAKPAAKAPSAVVAFSFSTQCFPRPMLFGVLPLGLKSGDAGTEDGVFLKRTARSWVEPGWNAGPLQPI